MRELLCEGVTGKSLRVYPHLAPDTPEERTVMRGHVEAIRLWNDDNSRVWGVQMNIGYEGLITRQKTDELRAALDRCWEWIDEQVASEQKG